MVDTNKGGLTPKEMLIRCRMVARDFKGNDKDRDDLFAEAHPSEAKRLLLSRTATRRRDRNMRKATFVDANKGHLNPACEKHV